MGNTFFCNRCDIDKFNLSRACVDQFLNDESDNKLSFEDRWMAKLKCLDDVHSKQNGLTEEAFNEMVDKLEKKLKSKNIPVYCRNRELLLECLGRNPNCMLNCKKEMDEFIDCVDALRVRRIKERIQDSMHKKKLDLDALVKS
ncbi:uncharacterized protein LOC123013720 [Tribolium madens]|uniref:uncharacterized protein LOC123013720 n=1 Tax=Tribolium madens TaxID=41895 RepID=UPI001CF724E8|nr:uncharacterized protein LOC123013720 [Tribolium madens]